MTIAFFGQWLLHSKHIMQSGLCMCWYGNRLILIFIGQTTSQTLHVSGVHFAGFLPMPMSESLEKIPYTQPAGQSHRQNSLGNQTENKTSTITNASEEGTNPIAEHTKGCQDP